ncbi:MAG: class I SAM-dependent methyltransferase [Acidimicrobiales bacterium]
MAETPGERWRQAVRDSTPPQDVIDRSPEPEATLEPQRFRWKPEEDSLQPVRPSRQRALEALPEGGSVLDVGVGGGASSLGLAGKAGLIIGVDPLEGMLESFEASGREAGVATQAYPGTWPDVAADVPPADVAVCHHAMYRAENIEDFVTALTDHARARVVVELSAQSPLAALNPLWKTIHGIDRPDWPVADLAEEAIRATGLDVEREDMLLPPRLPDVTPELVAFVRRRLFVGPEHDAEIEAFLHAREPNEHRVVAMWWPGEDGR